MLDIGCVKKGLSLLMEDECVKVFLTVWPEHKNLAGSHIIVEETPSNDPSEWGHELSAHVDDAASKGFKNVIVHVQLPYFDNVVNLEEYKKSNVI